MSSAQDHQDEAHFLGNDCELAPMGSSGMHLALARLVRAVHAETKPHFGEVAEQFAALAPLHIPGVSDTGVLLVAHARRNAHPANGDGEVRLIDQITEDTNEGPCVEAAGERRMVRVPDLEHDDRWPQFRRSMLALTPVRSMLCFQLYSPTQIWGSMTLCGHQPHSLGTEAEELGMILATHAAVTLEFVQQSRQYRSGLGSRDIIGQAKGLLMERYDLGPADAFSLLTRLALQSKRQVIVVAKELVETKSRRMV